MTWTSQTPGHSPYWRTFMTSIMVHLKTFKGIVMDSGGFGISYLYVYMI
jgi:hypothetical protein